MRHPKREKEIINKANRGENSRGETNTKTNNKEGESQARWGNNFWGETSQNFKEKQKKK